MVAGFWSDIDTRGSGSGLTWYKRTTYNGTPVFAVTYDSTGYFGGHVDKRVTFQIVIADTPTPAARQQRLLRLRQHGLHDR